MMRETKLIECLEDIWVWESISSIAITLCKKKNCGIFYKIFQFNLSNKVQYTTCPGCHCLLKTNPIIFGEFTCFTHRQLTDHSLHANIVTARLSSQYCRKEKLALFASQITISDSQSYSHLTFRLFEKNWIEMTFAKTSFDQFHWLIFTTV